MPETPPDPEAHLPLDAPCAAGGTWSGREPDEPTPAGPAPDDHGHRHGHEPAPAGPADHRHDHDHSADHGHGHDHGVAADADSRFLGLSLGLIVTFMIGEVIVAWWAHSLALFSDAGHMLTDAAALGAALYTVRLAQRPATEKMTYGWRRSEVLAAAANAVTLVAIGLLMFVEAVQRLVHPVAVDGLALVLVAAVGVVVNVLATWSLGRANRSRLSVAGAMAHLVTDIWAFLGTLIAGAVILATGWNRADSVASLVVVGLMFRAAWPLLRTAGRILLEATPEGVQLEAVRQHMLALPQVEAVHDLHAWVVTSDLPSVSAHVVVADNCFSAGSAPVLLDQLQACLAGHFDVEHSTFQLEPARHAAHEAAQHD